MALNMGDVVYHKSDENVEMVVHGFLSQRGENFNAAGTQPTDWVLCKYVKKDGAFATELFHLSELEQVEYE